MGSDVTENKERFVAGLAHTETTRATVREDTGMKAGISPSGQSTSGDRTATRQSGVPRPAGSSSRRRGQTTIDFAVGMSIFLLALAFVFVFVPGMLEPFEANTQSETPATNRVADDLIQRTLGNASRPYALDAECTRAFFEDSAPPANCHFDGDTTADRVGVKSRIPVNVTVQSDLDGDGVSDVVCWDAAAAQFEEQSSCTDAADVVLTRGSNPEGSGGKTVSATRIALLNGKDVTVEVVMW